LIIYEYEPETGQHVPKNQPTTARFSSFSVDVHNTIINVTKIKDVGIKYEREVITSTIDPSSPDYKVFSDAQ